MTIAKRIAEELAKADCTKYGGEGVGDVINVEWAKLESWLLDPQRKPPELAFTSGPARRLADLVQGLLQAERASHEVTKAQLMLIRDILKPRDGETLSDCAIDYVNRNRIGGEFQELASQRAAEIAELRSTQASLQQQLREATSKLGAWELDAKIQGWRREDAKAKVE